MKNLQRLKFLGKLCGAILIAGLALITPGLGLAAATDAFTPSEQVVTLKGQSPVTVQVIGFASTTYSVVEDGKMQRVIIRTDKATLPKQEGRIILWVRDAHVDVPLIRDEDGTIIVNKDKLLLPGDITIQGSKTEGYEIDR